MKSEAFYKELASFLKANDVNSATAIIMNELGTILVNDRNDFIVLLNASGIPAEDRDSDTELIQKFINNIATNDKLVIGTAFLVAHKNKTVGFDGDEEVNDAGVKAMNRAIKSYFDSRNFPDSADNYYSEAAGGAWASALQEGAKFGSKIAEGQQKKKFGGLDMAKQQADAKNKIVQSVLRQREMQRIAAQKKVDDAAKKRKKIIWISVGGFVLVAAIVTTVIIIKRKKK